MESIGQFLRNEREIRQLSLEELAQTTRIPLRSLQLLEEDRLDSLPGDVFVRGFLKSYAKAVGLGADDVVRRYEESSRPSKAPATPAREAVGQPDRGRRFGLAIALVILLILFTLALSIVLRPRHRDAPVELSQGDRIALELTADA
ncbi:MAG: helix-turn-helix domain-containing protein [Sandaracinaceae bacterium]|nr:helix-turn-helix domain-containing protein [Sandaracinaceae bacterium]